MFEAEKNTSKDLLKLCALYFGFYVITGIAVKLFTGKPAEGFLGMNEMEYLIASTLGGNIIAIGIVFIFKWYRFQSCQSLKIGSLSLPLEYLYIIPSGICTAVVIPTTTLMFSLPISVMIAMVIMRGSIIIISRIIDAIQIAQGILKKKVYWEENVAVVFAIIAVSINVFFASKKEFDFYNNAAAMTILSTYLVAYFIRLYIMNYYKNTRGKGVKQDNKGFYSIEQITACFAILLAILIVFHSPNLFGWSGGLLENFRSAIISPSDLWLWAVLAGTSFGAVSFFSVFIFMFKGRTATFAGLVNRLTSLIAGTAATLIVAIFFRAKFPSWKDWLSFLFILIAIMFLYLSERKRAKELKAEASITLETCPTPEIAKI